jgi:hypothetical protein
MIQRYDMAAFGDFMEMAKRLAAVEVKVEHLTEKAEATNNALEAHAIRTEKSLHDIRADMGSKLDQHGDLLKRITIWMEAAPKLIKIFIAILLAAILFSSNGWKIIVDMITMVIK